MMIRPLSILIAAAWFAASPAQAASHDGKWTAKWTGNDGRPAEAEVELAGETGKLRLFKRASNKDACAKQEAPVSVKTLTDGSLFLRAEYATALAGCANRSFTLKPVDDRTMKGTTNADKIDVVFTRD